MACDVDTRRTLLSNIFLSGRMTVQRTLCLQHIVIFTFCAHVISQQRLTSVQTTHTHTHTHNTTHFSGQVTTMPGHFVFSVEIFSLFSRSTNRGKLVKDGLYSYHWLV